MAKIGFVGGCEGPVSHRALQCWGPASIGNACLGLPASAPANERPGRGYNSLGCKDHYGDRPKFPRVRWGSVADPWPLPHPLGAGRTGDDRALGWARAGAGHKPEPLGEWAAKTTDRPSVWLTVRSATRLNDERQSLRSLRPDPARLPATATAQLPPSPPIHR